MFLVLKSAFNFLQILIDNQYIEASKLILCQIEDLLPDLVRIREMKKNYKPTAEHDKKSVADFDDIDEGLKVDSFSVSSGSFLPHSAIAPKNPCITEFEMYLTYFKTRIAMHDADEESRRKWARKVNFMNLCLCL